jgi:hypothetical protein
MENTNIKGEMIQVFRQALKEGALSSGQTPNPSLRSFGLFLGGTRIKAGLSLAALSEKIPCSSLDLWRIEMGYASQDEVRQALPALAQALDLKLSALQRLLEES